MQNAKGETPNFAFCILNYCVIALQLDLLFVLIKKMEFR